MQPNEITWDDGHGLEDLSTWGIEPLGQFIDILYDMHDEHSDDPEYNRVVWIICEMRDKVRGLKDAVYRIDRERRALQNN